MFTTTGLFDEVPCPEGVKCVLPFCIFKHPSKTRTPDVTPHGDAVATKRDEGEIDGDRALKRRRLEEAGPAPVSPESSATSPASAPATKVAKLHVSRTSTPVSVTRTVSPPARKASLVNRAASSQTKPDLSLPRKPSVTPTTTVSKPTPKTPVIEQLVPRKLGSPPVPFPMRVQLVKLMYTEYIRLNKLVAESNDPAKSALSLSKQEMISMVLDEEEIIAKENQAVYSNVIKHRIKRLRDMKTLEAWKAERLKQIAKDNPQKPPPKTIADARVKSGLTPKEELAMLSDLLTPIDDLAAFGYVPTPPTEAEIEEARRGLEMAKNWEQCDRCASRFQVFPGRRESDGALTTGGDCIYHWGRQRRPPKTATTMGLRTEDKWTCCGGEMGSDGCTTAASHVFKVSEPKRLALTMQFEQTTTTGPKTPESAVAFDCEMGYTSYGLEMIRLTATSWPSGDELIDVLVRPLGEIIDFNSRFSGITQEAWLKAIPYEDISDEKSDGTEPPAKKRKASDGSSIVGNASDTNSSQPLKIVSSPQQARDLLFKHLTTTTPLIGHAIDNDLNVVRICHPAIIDTVLLFPANRPLPVRMGLKVLAKKHLGIDIQMGGDKGHDSKEDARATGELVRFKLVQKCKEGARTGAPAVK